MQGEFPHFRRNFTLGVLNGTFFMAALAFLAGSTVLPVFISKLTDSRFLIGIFAYTESFGWLLPQLFTAVFLAHKKRVLYFYNGLSFIRLFLFGLSIASIFIFKDNYLAILISFGMTFLVFALVSGMAGVAFTEIVGKTIPLKKRGSFFGSRMFTGGLFAALAGLAVKVVISKYSFPYDFGYVCIISWVLMLLGLSVFAFVKEPDVRQSLDKAGPAVQFKAALKIFKDDRNFRKLAFSRAWTNTALMAIPFYVIFAVTALKAPEWMAGIYLTVQMTGYLGSNVLWAWLSNHVSNKLVIMLAGICRIVPPVLAFACCYFYINPYLFALIFLFIGMGDSGVEVGYITYLLEILPEKGRILSIGLLHTLIAPTVFFSGIGGWLSQALSLKWLFAAVFMTTVISLIVSSRLREPRLRSS